jgi:putative redox protein
VVELVDALRSGRSEGNLVGVRLPPQALFFYAVDNEIRSIREIMMEIIVTFPGNKKTSASVGRHTILTDQPVSGGGDGEAASPFAHFLTSIVSCAGIYVIYFCEKRGISTENIRIIQRDERDPETHRITKITLDIELPADFPEKYKKALLHTVDLCSVKKTIIDPPEFELSTTVAG